PPIRSHALCAIPDYAEAHGTAKFAAGIFPLVRSAGGEQIGIICLSRCLTFWPMRGCRVRCMPTFVLRLIAPRPNFAQTMTDAEREIMNRHAAHWRPYLERGDMVVFGPILTEDD